MIEEGAKEKVEEAVPVECNGGEVKTDEAPLRLEEVGPGLKGAKA
jgi:hypothetical protein